MRGTERKLPSGAILVGTETETRIPISASESLSIANPLAAPDWATITREVSCPLCGYNLRGLTNPRCPECGYQFEWPAVLDPDKDRHPYLFEHHARRNVWSFVQTFFHSTRSPSEFWKTLDPAQRVAPVRLLLYWLVYATIALLPALAGAGWFIWSEFQNSSWVARMDLWSKLRYAASFVKDTGFVTAVIVLALFPWLNFFALIIFQQTLRRSRVRAVQVFRCAIYCGDLVVWFSLAATAAVLALDPQDGFRRLRDPAEALFLQGDQLMTVLGCGLLVMMLINAFRLWVAYRTYLRFPRALSLIVASQIIVLLASIAAIACASEYFL